MGPGRWWYFKPSSTPPSPSQTTQKCQYSGTPGQTITTSAVVTPNGFGSEPLQKNGLKIQVSEFNLPSYTLHFKTHGNMVKLPAFLFGSQLRPGWWLTLVAFWARLGVGKLWGLWDVRWELGSVKRMSSIFVSNKKSDPSIGPNGIFLGLEFWWFYCTFESYPWLNSSHFWPVFERKEEQKQVVTGCACISHPKSVSKSRSICSWRSNYKLFSLRPSCFQTYLTVMMLPMYWQMYWASYRLLA